MAISADGLALVFKIIGKGGNEAAAEVLKPARAAEQTRAALGRAGNVTVGDFGARNARAAANSYRELGGALSGVSPRLGQFTGAGAAGGLGAIAAALAAAAKVGIEYRETLEKLNKSFETLTGSQAAARAHLKELQDFAAKTPFEFEDVARASQRFQNMGLKASEVVPILRAVGNAVAAAGGGSEQIDRVSLAISQMSAKGKVSAEEMNQLAEAGVGGWRLLEQQLGKTKGELMKMAEQGEISADTFIKAFRAAHENGNGMQKQMETLGGATSTLKDKTKELLSEAFSPLHFALQQITVEMAKSVTEGWNLQRALVAIHKVGTELGGPMQVRAATNIARMLGILSAEASARQASWGTPTAQWGAVEVPEHLKYKPRISDADVAKQDAARAGKSKEEFVAEGLRKREEMEREVERRREQSRREELRAVEQAEKAKLDVYRKHIKQTEELTKDVRRDIEEAQEKAKRDAQEWAGRVGDASDEVRAALRGELAIITEENQHLRQINDTIRAAEILQAIDARTAAFLRQLAVVNELAKVPVGADALAGAAGALGVVPIPQGAGQAGGPFVDPNQFGPPPELFTRWQEFSMVVSDALDTISTASVNAGQMVGGVFQGMGQAMSQSIQAWLLYGGSIGKMMKQAVAGVLAALAGEAAVKAIFQLAEGFAMLFLHPAKAGAHFKAAALYGAAAVAAGVGARAFAGGGGAAAGAAYAGGGSGFGPEATEREDNRTRYMREQEERDRHTRREDRRGDAPRIIQLVVNGRVLAQTALDEIRDGGDLRDGFRGALA